MTVGASSPDTTRRSPVLLVLGVILVAINLRPAAASVGPVLGRIESETGIGSGAAGALATLPVLCFGLLAPLAPAMARRLGVHRAIAWALWLLVLGMLLRLVPGIGFLFVGTAVAGTAIAIGNVLLPVLVRRDFPQRTGALTSLYTTVLMGFAALSAGLTVPLANGLGGGWRPGLAVWAVPAGLGAVAWLPALFRRAPSTRDPNSSSRQTDGVEPRAATGQTHTVRALMRDPLAWQVTLFFGIQSGIFYAMLSWLPSIFRSHGASAAHAGLLLSVSLIVGMGSALTVPGLAGRMRDQRLLVLVTLLLTTGGLLGILLAPMSAPYLWVVLLGLGQNGSFPLGLMMIMKRAGSVTATASLSTMAQSVGYSLAALAPIAVGALHGLSHSWTPPLILLVALLGPQFALGLGAGRDRVLAQSSRRPDQPLGDKLADRGDDFLPVGDPPPGEQIGDRLGDRGHGRG
jgi:CP family cyanate transporter-like MFS transporter